MLCPSDEDWLSQPTDNLLSSWARPLGGCRWDSVGGPWNPLLLAQLHLLTLRRPPRRPHPPSKRLVHAAFLLSTPMSILYFSPIHFGPLGHTVLTRRQNPMAQKS